MKIVDRTRTRKASYKIPISYKSQITQSPNQDKTHKPRKSNLTVEALYEKSKSFEIFYSNRLQSSSAHTEPDVVVDLFGEFVLAIVCHVEIVLLVFGAWLFVRIGSWLISSRGIDIRGSSLVVVPITRPSYTCRRHLLCLGP
jgi:hypothetical protein